MYRENAPPPPPPPSPAPRETYRTLWGLTAIVTMPLASCTGLAVGASSVSYEWRTAAGAVGSLFAVGLVVGGTMFLMRSPTDADKVDPPAATAVGYTALGVMAAVSLLFTTLMGFIPGEPGRPFRGPFGPRRARATRRSDWTDALPLERKEVDARLAAKWESAALAEHASIASFAQLSLDLLELGAPPDLVRRCHVAAIEEIDHAKKSFALASAHAGEPVGPSALRVPRLRRRATFARVRHESILDGCLNEARAAEALRAEAARAPEARVREMLSRIADDEDGHVRLAEDIVRFCTERDRLSA